MSAIKKEDVLNEIDGLNQFAKSLSDEEKNVFANRIRNIKKLVQKLLQQEE